MCSAFLYVGELTDFALCCIWLQALLNKKQSAGGGTNQIKIEDESFTTSTSATSLTATSRIWLDERTFVETLHADGMMPPTPADKTDVQHALDLLEKFPACYRKGLRDPEAARCLMLKTLVVARAENSLAELHQLLHGLLRSADNKKGRRKRALHDDDDGATPPPNMALPWPTVWLFRGEVELRAEYVNMHKLDCHCACGAAAGGAHAAKCACSSCACALGFDGKLDQFVAVLFRRARALNKSLPHTGRLLRVLRHVNALTVAPDGKSKYDAPWHLWHSAGFAKVDMPQWTEPHRGAVIPSSAAVDHHRCSCVHAARARSAATSSNRLRPG